MHRVLLVRHQPQDLLLVFADPAGESFGELAATLAELDRSAGAAHVLVPQGRHAPSEIFQRLQSSGWRPLFVHTAHADSLTRSFLEDPTALPALELETADGLGLFSGRWSSDDPQLLEHLRASLDAARGTRVALEKP